MTVYRTVDEMRGFSRASRCKGRTIALVPTMGALHAGHLALAREAARRADAVVVSIFVNQTQFGPEEDFNAYPRTLEADCRLLEAVDGSVVVFAPSASEMYPDGDPMTWVDVEHMTEHLCGRSRPGHFRGVATVVTKLFAVCGPDVAVFGLKDAQQFFVIERLVGDLNLGVELVGVPTVREPDGLAMSSRNKYLSAVERKQAVVLSRAVSSARESVEEGETDTGVLLREMRRILESADAGRTDYAEVVDVRDFQPVERLVTGMKIVAAVALYFGKARLIDNAIIVVP